MAPNPHALRASHSSDHSYHEVRRAVNLLVAWNGADRLHAEQMVDDWIAQGVDDVELRARDEANRDDFYVGDGFDEI